MARPPIEDEEFIALYRDIDRGCPQEWNSIEVDQVVAYLTGLPLDAIHERWIAITGDPDGLYK